MMTARIAGLAYHLPKTRMSNDELAALFPEWTTAKLEQKLGILERRIAAPGECASDLAVQAAEKLFAQGVVRREKVDYLLFCTQSPDFRLPPTACILQQRLGLPTSCGALDFNLGCSGFVYGLGLAKGLIETGQASNVLLLTAETYSRYIQAEDKNVRTLFGDAAAATWLCADEAETVAIGPFVFGTDGSGAKLLIVAGGGMREPRESGADPYLRMDGPAIFAFTLKTVPEAVDALLKRSGRSLADVDLYVLHQANKYMLECLRKKIGVSPEKFLVAMAHCGNTVSSTIPIALCEALTAGRLTPGRTVMLVGFGVGLSWAACMVRFP